MFDHNHYVPILRWKRAERIALRFLEPDIRARLTPLVELTPRIFSKRKSGGAPTGEEVLSGFADDVLGDWGGGAIFVDLCHPYSGLAVGNSTHPLEFLFARARELNLFPIPVTGLDRNARYQLAVRNIALEDKRGVCIRLRRDDIQQSVLRRDLAHLLSTLGLRERQIDLLVDFEIVGEEHPSYKGLCQCIPDLPRWRTFTVAAGAFPLDLSNIPLGIQRLARHDWLGWSQQVTPGSSLPRCPCYSDYTIQHPVYQEPPEHANFSASIRYTAARDWVIMRGEGVRNEDGPGYAQWPANANLLRRQPEFCGRSFSSGDEYIHRMSLQDVRTGSAETWLRAGFNHHLTFVVRQISSLFGT